jgi:hypothetical protein
MQSHSEILEHIVKENIRLKEEIVANYEEFKKEIAGIHEQYEQIMMMKDFILEKYYTETDEDRKFVEDFFQLSFYRTNVIISFTNIKFESI